MKRIALVLAVLCIGVTAATAQVSLGWGVHGNGANLDVKDRLSSVYGWGYGGGAHVDLNLMMITLRFSGDYITFAPDEDKYRNELAQLLGSAAAGYSIDGGNVNVLSASVNAKWTILPIPVVKPYLTGGIGLVQVSSGDLTVRLNGNPVGTFPKVQGETKTAFNAGAGVDLSLGPVTLFAEARYTWIMTEGSTTNYLPISVGITF